MKKILVLGAGLVARPLIRYLLDDTGVAVTVAGDVVDRANTIVAGHPHGTVVQLDIRYNDSLDTLVASHDLVVSLLPAPLHPRVGKACVEQRKHLVTTSYVSPEMRALDIAAKRAGVMLLNEVGLDPGIDHMSAMKVIHDVKTRGGAIVCFKSYCGGLPAPDANDNPWGYKCSWSPRAVCTAGKNAACYRLNGKTVHVPGPELFSDGGRGMHVEGVGDLEAYPNRDSLAYVDLYGLAGIDTMLRGTLRYPGWCETFGKLVALGCLDETEVVYPRGTTYAQFTAALLGCEGSVNLRDQVAGALDIDPSSDVLARLEWLGLFSQDEISPADTRTTPLDVLATRMGRKMAYREGERDMVVLCHEFVGRFPDQTNERITSTLIAYGVTHGDSAMARTVSLPAAVAAGLMLTDNVIVPGVQIPTIPEIYRPTLERLAELGIACVENRHSDGTQSP